MALLAELTLDDAPRARSAFADPDYHFPSVPWFGTWKGRTWSEMPGQDDLTQKMNFALFRRGLFKIEEPRVAALRSFRKHFDKKA